MVLKYLHYLLHEKWFVVVSQKLQRKINNGTITRTHHLLNGWLEKQKNETFISFAYRKFPKTHEFLRYPTKTMLLVKPSNVLSCFVRPSVCQWKFFLLQRQFTTKTLCTVSDGRSNGRFFQQIWYNFMSEIIEYECFVVSLPFKYHLVFIRKRVMTTHARYGPTFCY